MRTTVTVVAAGGAVREDARIEAPGATPVGELLAKLRQLVAEPAGVRAAIGGVAVEAETLTPFAGSALRDGAVVSFANPLPPTTPASYFELNVVGGPAAGTVHPLAVGTSGIGRGGTAAVRIDDPDVSRRHAVITVSTEGVTVADDGSTNGTALDGRDLGTSPVPLRPGMRLRVGQSTLALTVSHDAPIAVTTTDDARLSFNRPPRLDVPDRAARPPAVTFPAAPVERAPHSLPVIATVAPLFAGVLLAVVMRRPEFLLFTIVSPLIVAGQWVADRVGHRRARRVEQARYSTALAQAQTTLARVLADDVVQRRRRAPDAATLSTIAVGPGARLWERRRGDGDFLVVSLGSATLPAELALVDAPNGTSIDLHDVPATVSLTDVGVLGIAGPPTTTEAIARSIIGQLGVLHSPRELAIVLLTEPARVESWDWMRWLPHVQPAGDLASASCDALVGLDTESTAARAAELAALIETRQRATTIGVQPTAPRAVVVVIDGAWSLRRTRALATVLAHGPAVGIFAVCIDDAASRLPAECTTVAVSGTQNRLRLQAPEHATTVDIAADGVSVSWAEQIARALAPIRDDSPDRSGSLPDTVRWLDIAELDTDDTTRTADVVSRWRHPGGGSTRALVGVGLDGRFAIDLALDGPHTLVAGTTGSGKSELLQTLVASLAVANRPDELTFVLVDYKGGAAFGACAMLPHTVGIVTDLDGRLVERALVSLSAELKRREALLAATGAPNLDAFRSTGGRLARLVIVVDEFASLAEELPDFVGGLVSIAQRGRSLGVHLVLATQRPEGVVSADIRANTNLRICLGVTRESESRDVIDSSDAARISRTTPGRAFARTGHGELHAFHTGRVSGQPPSEEGDVIDVTLSPFRSLCRPTAQRVVSTRGDTGRTDLDDIVDACQAAATELRIDAAASPWLPPLPEVISSDDDGSEPMRPLVATLAILDVPTEQRRERYVVDLDQTSHLIIAGSARSGRTTALRTLVGGLVSSTSVSDLHVYVVDCAGGSLGALAAMPHCGAAVVGHESDRVGRLFAMLADELVTRQHLSAVQGWSSLTEQREASTSPLPHIVLLIDGWETFSNAFDDQDAGVVLDAAWRLVREGASVGIHVVATADRAGLVGRLASSVQDRLVLKLADRSDFSMIGVPVRAVPTVLPAGRGFLADRLREAQVCVLGRGASGAAQLAMIATIATAAHERASKVPRSAWPRRVDPLPASVTLAELIAGTGDVDHESTTAARVVLGVGGDELGTVSVDLLEARPGFLIAGPARSGRSTALATIACGLRTAGWRIVAVAPRPSIISAHADHVVDATGLGLETALADDTVALLVDDAELLTESPVATILDRITRTARDTGQVVVIAGMTDELSLGFRGFIVDARRARAGLLLNPRSALDGDVLGIRLPRSTGAPAPAGRGLLVIGTVVSRLQVARPDEIDDSSRQPQTVTDRLPIAAPSCVTVTLTTPSAAPVK